MKIFLIGQIANTGVKRYLGLTSHHLNFRFSSRYEIHQVVGPNEFHTHYPGQEEPGLTNNAYTNFMASWSIQKALFVFDLLGEDRKRELLEMIDLFPEDLYH